MFLDKLITLIQAVSPIVAEKRRAVAATSAAVEALPPRLLLSGNPSSYNVPLIDPSTNTPATAVYLRANAVNVLDVDVRLNSPTTTTIAATLSPDPTTHLISIHGQYNGLIMHDRTTAAQKDPNGGIFFDNSENGVLEVDAGGDNTLMEVKTTTSTSGQIESTDGSGMGAPVGEDFAGVGVPNLTMLGSSAGNETFKVDELDSEIHLTIDTRLGTNNLINLGSQDGPVAGVMVFTGTGNDTVNVSTADDEDAVSATVDFGPGNGSGNGLGLGNTLNIGINGTATLLASGHTDVVDHVNVGGGTLKVNSASTIGDCFVGPDGVALVSAPLLVAASGSLTGTMEVESDTITFTAGSNPSTIHILRADSTGIVNLNAGSKVTADTVDVQDLGKVNVNSATLTATTFDLDGGSTQLNANGGSIVTVSTFPAFIPGGTVNVATTGLISILQASTIQTVNISGTVGLAAGGTTTLVINPAEDSTSAHLSITATGQLDIKDNDVIVKYGTGSSVKNDVRNLIKNGRNGGPAEPGGWNSLGGVTSSFASPGTNPDANGFNLAIGYGDNADIATVRGSGSYGVFGGQTVGINCVLIKMTRGADATLDGVVDAQDVTALGSHFNKPDTGQWCFGDFDYSGACDATDVTTLGATFAKTSPAVPVELDKTRALPAWMEGFTSLIGPAPDGDLEFSLTTDGTGQLDVSWTDVLLDYRQWAQYGSSDPIDWSTVSNVSYRVRFTTDVNWGSFSRVILNADVTSTSLTGLASNTTYYVRVVALSPAGNVLSGVEDATTA